jgi:hypothetical protein
MEMAALAGLHEMRLRRLGRACVPPTYRVLPPGTTTLEMDHPGTMVLESGRGAARAGFDLVHALEGEHGRHSKVSIF